MERKVRSEAERARCEDEAGVSSSLSFSSPVPFSSLSLSPFEAGRGQMGPGARRAVIQWPSKGSSSPSSDARLVGGVAFGTSSFLGAMVTLACVSTITTIYIL